MGYSHFPDIWAAVILLAAVFLGAWSWCLPPEEPTE
jgi:hypothetical protein